MNIDNFEGRSVALGGEVWRTGARAGLGGIASPYDVYMMTI